jgi:hypothetical protein
MKPEEIYKQVTLLSEVKKNLNEEIVGELFMFRLEKRINELMDKFQEELHKEQVIEYSNCVIDY